MTAKEVKELLEKQLQLLSERSCGEASDMELTGLTRSMCEVIDRLDRIVSFQ